MHMAAIAVTEMCKMCVCSCLPKALTETSWYGYKHGGLFYLIQILFEIYYRPTAGLNEPKMGF